MPSPDPSFVTVTGPRWDRARGSRVNGRLLDFRSGVMTASMGHAPQRLIDPMVRAVKRGMAQAWYSPNTIRERAIEAMRRILPPSFEDVLFLVTGSEAVEVACRMAMELRPGKKVAHFEGNYHGNTKWILENLNGDKGVSFPMDHGDFPKGVGVMVMTPYLAAWCAWMEPQREDKFREWLLAEDIILIDDEVQAGFGRCGAWWGYQRYFSLDPHFIVFGKAATGLLPCSGIAVRVDVAGLISQGDWISTHAGNPICLSVLAENVRWMIREDAPQLAMAIENRIESWATGMAHDGRGAAWSIYLRSAEQAKRVIDTCADSVMLFDTGLPVIKIAPPLNIKKRDLLDGLGQIRDALTAVGGFDSVCEVKR
jgi:4-aminobutyrate aminotransferase-like enzyme